MSSTGAALFIVKARGGILTRRDLPFTPTCFSLVGSKNFGTDFKNFCQNHGATTYSTTTLLDYLKGGRFHLYIAKNKLLKSRIRSNDFGWMAGGIRSWAQILGGVGWVSSGVATGPNRPGQLMDDPFYLYQYSFILLRVKAEGFIRYSSYI